MYDKIHYKLKKKKKRILEWEAIPFSRGLPTQGSNPGLPHFRQILD